MKKLIQERTVTSGTQVAWREDEMECKRLEIETRRQKIGMKSKVPEKLNNMKCFKYVGNQGQHGTQIKVSEKVRVIYRSKLLKL